MTSSWRQRSIGSNFLSFIFFAIPLWADLYPDEKVNVDIYKRCSPAVVNITAVTLTQDFFFEIVPQKGAGSGAVVRGDGFIVTNDHVVGDAQQVEVTLHDKTRFPAKVVGRDPDSDLAVIRIDTKGKSLLALDYGVGDLSVGQKVLAIGNPFGLGGSLSVGIISSLNRDIRATNNRTIKDVIQTDAAINPGNSGGPLLDSSGKLIGINAQIVSRSGGSEGIGFAISAKTVKRIVDQLIQFGKVLRPTLGVYGIGLPDGLLESWGIASDHGVMLTETYRNSPALKSGLKIADKELVMGFRRIPFGGDIVFQIDETPVATMAEILDYVGEKKPGDVVVLHYFRGRQKRTASVKLALPPELRNRAL